MAVYEIVHRSLPDHAVSEHVELSKQLLRPDAGGFVNGVLRALLRRREEGSLPVPEVPAEVSADGSYRCACRGRCETPCVGWCG